MSSYKEREQEAVDLYESWVMLEDPVIAIAKVAATGIMPSEVMESFLTSGLSPRWKARNKLPLGLHATAFSTLFQVYMIDYVEHASDDALKIVEGLRAIKFRSWTQPFYRLFGKVHPDQVFIERNHQLADLLEAAILARVKS